MVSNSLVIFVLFACASSLALSLDPSAPPGKNFVLSNWKLTLPDASVSNILPAQLSGGYESQYFYTDKSDGSMTFWTPAYGGHTPNTEYPRSELRQRCNPSSDDYNWKIADRNTMKATLRADKNVTAEKTVVLQIHSYNGPPLIKVEWTSKGDLYALYKKNHAGDDAPKVLLGKVGNDKFDFEINVDAGILETYLNGNRTLQVDVSSYWSDYTNFFKAGNYLQSNTGDQYSIIHFYALAITNTGNCAKD